MMLQQIFNISDVPRIFVLAFIELLLSADNAVVLGLLTHNLPSHLRRKALFIGVISAFFLRAAALAAIGVLFKYIWIQLLGAAYLLHLSISYFTKPKKGPNTGTPHSFWKVVLMIELLDLVFAIDSIVAGLGFISAEFSKLWIVYIGGMIGLIGMRYAAELFSFLIDRFPRLEASAYILVGGVGAKLALAAINLKIPFAISWAFILIVLGLGFTQRQKKEHE